MSAAPVTQAWAGGSVVGVLVGRPELAVPLDAAPIDAVPLDAAPADAAPLGGTRASMSLQRVSGGFLAGPAARPTSARSQGSPSLGAHQGTAAVAGLTGVTGITGVTATATTATAAAGPPASVALADPSPPTASADDMPLLLAVQRQAAPATWRAGAVGWSSSDLEPASSFTPGPWALAGAAAAAGAFAHLQRDATAPAPQADHRDGGATAQDTAGDDAPWSPASPPGQDRLVSQVVEEVERRQRERVDQHARWLWPRLRSMLAAELRLDRERAGRTRDRTF